MLRLRDTKVTDFWPFVRDSIVDVEEVEYYYKECHLRTVVNDTYEVVAIAMADSNGEIGLLVHHEKIKGHRRRFLFLSTIFLVEAFGYSDGKTLFSGFDDNPRDLRWARYLGFEVAHEQLPEHTERGWSTYELPLERWVL